VIKQTVLLACVTLSILLCGPAAPAWAQGKPPAPIIPEELLSGELLPTHRKMITDRLDWWKRLMLSARNSEEIIEARDSLLQDFTLYTNVNYRQKFADMATERMLGLVTGEGIPAEDELKRLKVINMAMAFSRMHYPSAMPALTAMVAGDNAAVRYFGWQAMLQGRPTILRAGQQYVGDFQTALADALVAEESGEVLKLIYQAADMDDKQVADVEDPIKEKLRQTAMTGLSKSWDTRRLQVMNSHPEILQAMEQAVVLLESLGRQPVHKIEALQRVVDLANSVAKQYDQKLQQFDTSAEYMVALEVLLRRVEDAMQALSQKDLTLLRKAMNADADKGAAVRMAVLEWIDAIKVLGVEDPKPPVGEEPAKTE
jgi:hypothetical protein